MTSIYSSDRRPTAALVLPGLRSYYGSMTRQAEAEQKTTTLSAVCLASLSVLFADAIWMPDCQRSALSFSVFVPTIL